MSSRPEGYDHPTRGILIGEETRTQGAVRLGVEQLHVFVLQRFPGILNTRPNIVRADPGIIGHDFGLRPW
jgi:hypothetical protein